MSRPTLPIAMGKSYTAEWQPVIISSCVCGYCKAQPRLYQRLLSGGESTLKAAVVSDLSQLCMTRRVPLAFSESLQATESAMSSPLCSCFQVGTNDDAFFYNTNVRTDASLVSLKATSITLAFWLQQWNSTVNVNRKAIEDIIVRWNGFLLEQIPVVIYITIWVIQLIEEVFQ